MLFLLVAPALADDVYQLELTLNLTLVHAAEANRGPWGVRLGTDAQVAFGDSCYRSEQPPDCRDQRGPIGSLWPVVAPGFGVTWRPRAGWGGDVGLSGGVASVGMYDFGFLPHAEVLATYGHRWGHRDGHGRREAPAMTLGGFVTKTFSPRFWEPEGSYTITGTDALGARFDFHWAHTDGGWTPDVWRLGLQSGTVAGDLY